jgi:hypothetical protein
MEELLRQMSNWSLRLGRMNTMKKLILVLFIGIGFVGCGTDDSATMPKAYTTSTQPASPPPLTDGSAALDSPPPIKP